MPRGFARYSQRSPSTENLSWPDATRPVTISDQRRQGQDSGDCSHFTISFLWQTAYRNSRRRELVQVAAPGLPLVRGAGRLVEDVLDAGLLQRFVHGQGRLQHALLAGAGAEP